MIAAILTGAMPRAHAQAYAAPGPQVGDGSQSANPAAAAQAGPGQPTSSSTATKEQQRRNFVSPTISWESTWTNNVGLAADRKSDWINEIRPGLQFAETSAHSKVDGTVSLSALAYARTSSNDRVLPQANIAGTLEAIDRLLYIDGTVDVSQQYLSPFGARPQDISSATQNRYTSQRYTVSPYLKAKVGDGIDYELRQKSTWSNANGSAVNGLDTRSYMNEVSGHVAREARPGGWRLEYDRNNISFAGQSQDERSEIARATGLYRFDPTFQAGIIGGYEDDRFFLTRQSGTTYGVTIDWHPNSRMSLTANGEHRFFGTSYHVKLDDHTRHLVWSLDASRDVTSYPQQLGTLQAGQDVSALLNALFAPRVPDPAQRQSLVEQFIRDRGLPSSLSSPLALLTQELTLSELARGTIGLVGARNSILVNAFRSRVQPVPGTEQDLTPLLSQLINTTQSGAGVTWTDQLAPSLSLVTNGTWARTTQDIAPLGTTRLYELQAILTRNVSTLTSIHAGLRYQDSRSDVSQSFREFAVFVGLTHGFR
ncbi:MAG TPA: TIGR03016 family PEP-CTERM system-associated outer membrane protein [Vicinamibacterales bacterium]|nr:TIGR03016 family PEP-CTERM system-associated outer membrane protein [Vicinamibacterales bacterium]